MSQNRSWANYGPIGFLLPSPRLSPIVPMSRPYRLTRPGQYVPRPPTCAAMPANAKPKPVRKTQSKWVEPNRVKDFQTMVRSSRDDKAVFHALAHHWGISVSDCLVLLARKECRKEGLTVRDLDHYR